jgi:Zn-dependent protease
MGSTFRLGRIFGIPIGLHWSLLLILFWILYSVTDTFKVITGDQTTAFLYAGAFAVLFYLSILLHELGHAFAARHSKIGISGIDLWMFGGIAKMSRDADSAWTEFKVAVAGPLVTLLIAVVLIAALLSGFDTYGIGDGLTFTRSGDQNATALLIADLAFLNVWLLLFNLIPAFPMDGGRIARSIAWKITGSRTRATNFAGTLGQIFSYLMIGVGGFLIITGDFGGLFLIFIGMFIGGAARDAVQQTAVLSRLDGISVADVMDDEPVAVPGDMTVGEAMHEYFLRYRYPWFPVIGGDGRYIGLVEYERAQRIPDEKQPVFKVNEIMEAEGDLYRVRSDDPLEALLTSEPLRRFGALMAVDRDGHLRGIVTIDQINKALQQGVAPTI